MIRRLSLLAVLLCALTTIAAAPRTTLNDVEDEVMCPVCGVPLNIAESPQANDERALIRDLVAQGKTKAEVKQALVAEYGRAVLATPSDEGFRITDWLLPGLVALGLLGGALILLPRWRRRRPAAASGPGPGPGARAPELTPDETRRLDEDLARFR
jgi:cytochrome c-type biogenesis protein CcmH